MTGPSDPAKRGPTTRRTALKLFGGAAGVTGASALGLAVFSRSGRAAVDDGSFTAADVELASDDGTVSDIWLRPDLSYSWDGLNSPPESVSFAVEAETPALSGGFETIGTETDADVTGGTAGTDAYAFAAECSLLDGPWAATDFQPPAGGEKTTGPIRVRVTADLRNGDANAPYSDTATAEFSVVVSDGQVRFGDSGTGVSGEAGTGGSAGGSDGTTTGTTTTRSGDGPGNGNGNGPGSDDGPGNDNGPGGDDGPGNGHGDGPGNGHGS